MTRSRSVQLLRYLGSSLLLMGVFEACSGDDSAPTDLFDGPPTLSITGISLGSGMTGQGGDSSVLACDNTIGVAIALTNWTLYPPGKCGSALQCGQVRVSLLDGGPNGAVLSQRLAASLGADLNVSTLVTSDKLHAGGYTIQAELVDDAGVVYAITNGGNSTTEQTFNLTLADGCAEGTAGAGGSSEGDMGGEPFIGAGGFGGSADERDGAGGVHTP